MKWCITEDLELRLVNELDALAISEVTGDVSHEECLSWIRTLLDYHAKGEGIPCGIWVRGELAGYLILEIHANRNGLFHYGLLPAFRGQGWVTLACSFMVEYAFNELGLDVVKVDPLAANMASCRVAERIGFRRVGTMTVPSGDGGTLDIARYRLTAPEWQHLSVASGNAP